MDKFYDKNRLILLNKFENFQNGHFQSLDKLIEFNATTEQTTKNKNETKRK